MKNDSFITLVSDDDEEIEVEVIDTLTLDGTSFLLVAEANDEEESDCFIIKQTSDDGINVSYVVCDEDEQEKVFELFENKLSNEDIKLINRR